MKELKTPQIFIAHASEDKPKVRELYTRLKQSGLNPWLDEKDLLPGQNWRDEIPNALRKSDFFIACLSSQSISKQGYIQREFRQALNLLAERPTGTIYLIPLKLDDCEIPDLRQNEYGINIRDYQSINYWEDDGYEKLIKSINYQWEKQGYQFPDNNSSLFYSSKMMEENELQRLQEKYEQIDGLNRDLSTQIIRLESAFDSTYDEEKKIGLEKTIREKKSKLKSYEQELDSLKEKISSLRLS